MSESLKSLPLENWHQDHGARFAPFAGYNMPVQYEGIIAEHMATRKKAGLFDVSHMGEAVITGPGAEDFLEFISTNRIIGLPPGKAVYTLLCNEAGGTVDDIIIYHREPGIYLICLNAANRAKDIEWLNLHAEDFDCEVEDQSENFCQIALQGPMAWTILEKVVPAKAAALGRFRCMDTELAGAPVFLSRTGYTGEDGAEIYLSPDHAPKVADALLEAGSDHGIALCGLGARDTLRLEAGYPLYGHEITDTIGPLQAGLSWTVKFKSKDRFVGRTALEQQFKKGYARTVKHFVTGDRRILREGTPILQEGKEVGVVLSGGFSPILSSSMGSMLLDHSWNKENPLIADIRGKSVEVQLATPPLHLQD